MKTAAKKKTSPAKLSEKEQEFKHYAEKKSWKPHYAASLINNMIPGNWSLDTQYLLRLEDHREEPGLLHAKIIDAMLAGDIPHKGDGKPRPDTAIKRDDVLKWLATQSDYSIPDDLRKFLPSEALAAYKYTNDKPLSTTEYNSLFRLVIGMAVAGYKYNPKAHRNNATADIRDDLEKLGIPLDDATILKWLRQAAELLPATVDES